MRVSRVKSVKKQTIVDNRRDLFEDVSSAILGTINYSELRTRGPPLPNRFWREIGGFSQARIVFFQKLKCELRKRHFWIVLFLEKSSVEFLFEEGSLFFGNHIVVIVLSTGDLKSILFEGHILFEKYFI